MNVGENNFVKKFYKKIFCKVKKVDYENLKLFFKNMAAKKKAAKKKVAKKKPAKKAAKKKVAKKKKR